jgi:hypothetical protein
LVDETTMPHAAFLVMALQQNSTVKVIETPTAKANLYNRYVSSKINMSWMRYQ